MQSLDPDYTSTERITKINVVNIANGRDQMFPRK